MAVCDWKSSVTSGFSLQRANNAQAFEPTVELPVIKFKQDLRRYWLTMTYQLASVLYHFAGIITGTGSANERMCYILTPFPIGWAHTQYDTCLLQRMLYFHQCCLAVCLFAHMSASCLEWYHSVIDLINILYNTQSTTLRLYTLCAPNSKLGTSTAQ